MLRLVDSRVTDQENVTMRSISFLNEHLFDGQAKPVVSQLEASAQVSDYKEHQGEDS